MPVLEAFNVSFCVGSLLPEHVRYVSIIISLKPPQNEYLLQRRSWQTVDISVVSIRNTDNLKDQPNPETLNLN